MSAIWLVLIIAVVFGVTAALVKSSGNGTFAIPTLPALGTSVAQSASADTFGTYVQMIASTAEADYITGLVFSLNSTAQPAYFAAQIGTGSGGAETLVGQVVSAAAYSDANANQRLGGYIPIVPWIPIAASTRIAVATASNVASALAWRIHLVMQKQSEVVDAGVNESADLQTIKTQTVTCSGGVTVPAATLASTTNITSATGIDVTKVDGAALGTHASGMFPSDVRDFGGSAGTFASGRPEVNATHIDGTAWSTHASGMVPADVRDYGGSAGTFSGGRPEVNTTHIAGSAISTSTAQIGVNVVNWSGSAVQTPVSSGVPVVDWRAARLNTAAGGGAASITLDGSASSVDNTYRRCNVTILAGTGAGQTQLITAYSGSTKVATVGQVWATNPDATSIFVLTPGGADMEMVNNIVVSASLGVLNVNVSQISTDATAADNLEAILDGTGGTGLTVSTITASGAVSFNSFAVTTTTTLSGAVSLGSTLTVSGTTSLAALTTSGTVTFNAFTVTGATTLTGAVSATNASNDIRGITISSIGNDVITAASIAADAITEIQSGLATTVQLAAVDADVLTRLAAADYTAPDNAGIAAIQAKTDLLAFTVSGFLDVNVQYVNDVQVKGTGAIGDEWGPA